jgi:hypothetical protein
MGLSKSAALAYKKESKEESKGGPSASDCGGGNVTTDTAVKQIFVLDEEMAAASNTQSIQESKAMTPCFLHTPNMTNKWNDFKPSNN